MYKFISDYGPPLTLSPLTIGVRRISQTTNDRTVTLWPNIYILQILRRIDKIAMCMCIIQH